MILIGVIIYYMKKFVLISLMATIVSFAFVIDAQAGSVQHYSSSCHLHAGKGEILVNFGNTIILSDRHPNNIHKALSLPAGKYKVQLEAFDGYKGRSKTDPRGQAHEQYYIRFMSGNREVVRSNTTGDVPDRVEKAYWRGTVNNSLNINENISSIYIQHAVLYKNRYPNSVRPVCMVLTKIENGVCGSANGGTFNSKPTTGLCASGSVANFSGNGPWSWRCLGAHGGSNSDCSAKITKINGTCGSANGGTFNSKPTTGLCASGSVANFSGNGPWSWRCLGAHGGSNSTCGATKTAKCGDGHIDPQLNETCDDGNTVNGDGCSSSCKIELASIKIKKDDADNHDDKQKVQLNAKATFTITVTNVGEKNLENIEIVDPKEPNCNRSANETKKLYDGNLFDAGESFTYTCIDSKVESGYTNIVKVTAKSVNGGNNVQDSDSTVISVSTPDPVCGNGKVEANETCDDGNTVNGDGCSSSCKIESNPEPTPQPQPQNDEDEEDDDGAIGNFVWHDRNKNGVQDPDEEGIPGVKLKLYHGNHVETDRTNSRGHYKFKDLKSGHYKVIVAAETLPEGCYQTYDKDHKLDNKVKVYIEEGEYYKKADFGYYCPSVAPVTQVSPQTGAGTTAGVASFVIAALSAGFVYRRNTKKIIEI